MALVRWRNRNEAAPWSALRELEDEMSRVFGDQGPGWPGLATEWIPSVDLNEKDDEYVLEADLPGMTKDDIEVVAMDNAITVKGERKGEHESTGKGYHRFERRYGSFQRTFEIPGGFDSDKVDAKYEDGVLRVKLPKREESKPKQLNVKVK